MAMTALAFNAALVMGEAIEVGINEVHFVKFAENNIRGIGTQYLNLNGSTVIVMLSSSGAIVANVPHLPFTGLYPCAEMRNAYAKLEQLLFLYHQNSDVLGPEQTCLVVGLGGGGPNCPTSYYLNYVDCRLAQNNIGSDLVLYGASPYNVTVFVDAREGSPRIHSI